MICVSQLYLVPEVLNLVDLNLVLKFSTGVYGVSTRVFRDRPSDRLCTAVDLSAPGIIWVCRRYTLYEGFEQYRLAKYHPNFSFAVVLSPDHSEVRPYFERSVLLSRSRYKSRYRYVYKDSLSILYYLKSWRLKLDWKYHTLIDWLVSLCTNQSISANVRP